MKAAIIFVIIVYKIFNFLEISERNYVGKLMKFVTEKSRRNTQLFNREY